MRIISVKVPLVFTSFALTTIFQSFGDTRTPTILNVAGSLINIVLDPLMIFGSIGFPSLGIAGAAIATVLSHSIIVFSATILLIRGFRFESLWLKKMFTVGSPIIIQMLTSSLAFTVFLAIINIFRIVAATAYTIGMTVINLIEAFLMGFSQGISIIVGQNLGANNIGRAYKATKISISIVGLLLLVGSIGLYFFKDSLIGIFMKQPETIEEALLLRRIFNETRKFIDIVSFSIPFFGIFCVNSCC